MKPKTDFTGKKLELSYPVGEMSWDKAMSTEWADGWRMPTRLELLGLFHEAEEHGHTFDDKLNVWTASPYAIVPTSAWDVDFDVGFSFAYSKTATNMVRLVRG